MPGVKPTIPVEIDWTHPLAKGLLFFCIEREDLVRGGVAIPVNEYGSAPQISGSAHRQAMGFALESHTTTDGGFMFEGSSVENAVGQPFGTIATIVQIDSWVDWGQLVTVPLSKTTWVTPFHGFSLSRSAGTSSGVFYKKIITAGLNSATSGTGYLAADGLLNHYVVTTDKTSTVRFYKNGVAHSTDTLLLGAGDFDFPQMTPYVMSRNTVADGEGVNGRSFLSAIWAHDLKAGEVAEFYADPFALLKPKVAPIYFTSTPPPPSASSVMLPLPRPWMPGQKPTIPVEIDWSHPLAKGLAFLTIGGADLVGGAPPIPFDSAFSRYTHGKNGLGFHCTDDQLGGVVFEYGNNGPMKYLEGTDFYTIAVLGEYDSVATDGQLIGIPADLTWNPPFAQCMLYKFSTSTTLRVWHSISASGGGQSASSTGFLIADGSLHMYVGTKDTTDSAKFYRDGVFHSSNVGVDCRLPVFRGTAMQDHVYLGGQDVLTAFPQFEGRTYFAAYWARELSAGEIRQLYADPYAMLKPKIPTVYFISGEAVVLDNDLLSSMYFQRHYSPITIGV